MTGLFEQFCSVFSSACMMFSRIKDKPRPSAVRADQAGCRCLQVEVAEQAVGKQLRQRGLQVEADFGMQGLFGSLSQCLPCCRDCSRAAMPGLTG
jgi:hypothetical protein